MYSADSSKILKNNMNIMSQDQTIYFESAEYIFETQNFCNIKLN